MNILTTTYINNSLKANSPVEGVMFFKDFQVKLTSTGSEYIDGTLQSQGTIGFKAWNNSDAYNIIKNNDFSGKPVIIVGKRNDYNGTVSLIIENICVAPDTFTMDMFVFSPYNRDSFSNGLQDLCKRYLTEKGYSLLDTILFSDVDLYGSFIKEYAAKSHHDNCPTGLLAHTYKCVLMIINFITTYPDLAIDDSGVVSSDRRDLLIIGTVLHDIGKVMEMHYGVYQPESVVTHRVLGLDMLYKHRDLIVSTYSESWFRHLQSIIVQHHDEYEEKCRTLVAYVVHTADLIESRLQFITESLKDTQRVTTDSTGKKIYVDGKYLVI